MRLQRPFILRKIVILLRFFLLCVFSLYRIFVTRSMKFFSVYKSPNFKLVMKPPTMVVQVPSRIRWDGMLRGAEC